MAKGGHAKAPAGAPFSELSDDNRAWLKSYEERGWLAEYKDGGYWASKAGLEPLGAFDSFMVMMNSIEARERDLGNDVETSEFTAADPNPDDRLPGMEEPEIGELNNLADVCIAKLQAKKLATVAQKDADDIMREKMREYGRKRYNRGGWSIVIEDSEKLVIKKAEASTPKNPSTKKDRGPKVIKGGGK